MLHNFLEVWKQSALEAAVELEGERTERTVMV